MIVFKTTRIGYYAYAVDLFYDLVLSLMLLFPVFYIDVAKGKKKQCLFLNLWAQV